MEDPARLGPALYQGVAKASVGYKMLSSLGWREGEGLVRAARATPHRRTRRNWRRAAAPALCAGARAARAAGRVATAPAGRRRCPAVGRRRRL
jgi:hypothetical protein